MSCPECYDTEHLILWRDEPMNEEIRKTLDPVQRYANIHHLTLDDALRAWGEHPEDTHNAEETESLV